MALSFEDEVRGYLEHAREQNPVLNALKEGDTSAFDVLAILEVIGDVFGRHADLLIRAAQEIDKLSGAADAR